MPMTPHPAACPGNMCSFRQRIAAAVTPGKSPADASNRTAKSNPPSKVPKANGSLHYIMTRKTRFFSSGAPRSQRIAAIIADHVVQCCSTLSSQSGRYSLIALSPVSCRAGDSRERDGHEAGSHGGVIAILNYRFGHLNAPENPPDQT